MIDEHAAAVLALLDADNASPALNVYDGKVPDGTDPRTSPYVLVYCYSTDPDLDFTGRSYTFTLNVVAHCVGGNAQAARMVADRVRTALVDVTPAVSGRSCYPIRRTESVPPQRDESTGSTVMDQVDTYVLSSVPG
jgi:hypothetical protein